MVEGYSSRWWSVLPQDNKGSTDESSAVQRGSLTQGDAPDRIKRHLQGESDAAASPPDPGKR